MDAFSEVHGVFLRVLSEVLCCSVFSNSRTDTSLRYFWRHVTLFHRKPLIGIVNLFQSVIRCSVISCGRLFDRSRYRVFGTISSFPWCCDLLRFLELRWPFLFSMGSHMVIQMRWWIGFQLLVLAHVDMCWMVVPSRQFATSRTVSIRKSSIVDDKVVYREVT